MAVRVAIGAGRARLIQQLLTESLVLSILGGVAGYVFVVVAWRLVPAVMPPNVPRLAAAQAAWSTFGAALVVALVSGTIFGLAPAVRAALDTPFPSGGSRSELGTRDRTRSTFLAAQVALAMLLVIGGAQLFTGFGRLINADLGFDSNGLIASVVLASGDRYRTPEARADLYGRIVDSVRTIPGVDAAGTVDALPFSGENHGGFASASAEAAMRPGGQITAEIDVVSPGYLETMRARLVEGRWFHDEERAVSSDVAIITDTVATSLWPGESALGKRLCVFCSPELPSNWKRVVGVVAAMRHSSLDKPAGGSIYLSGGAFENAQFLVVRSERPASEIGPAIRRTIAAIDANQPVFLTAPISSFIADSVAERRFVMILLTAMGLLAWGISAAGVYGVISYVVSRRRQEIGLRMALGATFSDVHALVFRQGSAPVSAGLISGTAAAFALMRMMRHVLPGLDKADLGVTISAVLLVAIAAAAACLIPSRRAAHVDPMTALRQDS